MDLPPDSRFRLCETADGSWQLLRAGEPWTTFLGFDPEPCRFVCISFCSAPDHHGSGGEPASLQRLERIQRIKHPTIGRIYETGKTESGNFFCVSEFVEGEPLLNYLQRNPDLPDDLLGCILLDMADAIGVLAEFPRFLSCVEVNDFLVTLDRGIFPGLRLARFGLNREDSPASDFQLAERWVRITGGVHIAIREGHNPAQACENVPEHPEYAKLWAGLRQKSGVDAILHLKELNHTIQKVSGIQVDAGYSVPVKHRKIRHIKQVAQGPLQQLLYEGSELSTVLKKKFETRMGDIRYGVSPYLIPASIRNENGDMDAGNEIVHLYLLPPERLFEASFIERLNRKMFDSYLKAHPNGVRGRSLICEKNFTLLVADRFEGLPLPCLQARKGRFSSADVLAIVRQMDRILGQFECARFPFDRLDPWQIEIYFESVGEEEIPSLIENTPIEEWPAWDLKLRVEIPADVFIEPAYSSWSYLRKRFHQSSFPAIFVWLLEGDRFEWALRNGLPNQEPLSWNPLLDECLKAAVTDFNDADPAHRDCLISYARTVFDHPGDSCPKWGTEGLAFVKSEQQAVGSFCIDPRNLPKSQETVR